MKVICPNCSKALNTPDHLIGKRVVCPACKQKFVANAVVANVDVAISEPASTEVLTMPPDELALQPFGVDESHAPQPDPTAIKFCPLCGEKWSSGARECRKCDYNAIVGGRLRTPVPKRLRFNFDIQSLYLYVFLVAVVYGIYWFSQNWTSVKHSIQDRFDNAARAEPTADDSQNLVRKNKLKE